MTYSNASLPTARQGYIITGRAAHERIARLFSALLPKEPNPDAHSTTWVDLSPYAERLEDTSAATTTTTASSLTTAEEGRHAEKISVAFLWENSPRSHTKAIRDAVRVYSHLPHGTAILDDKWVLARLSGDVSHAPSKPMPHSREQTSRLAATLESHCFRGSEFYAFVQRVGLLPEKKDSSDNDDLCCLASTHDRESKERFRPFEDLMHSFDEPTATVVPPPTPTDLWVIKDAMSNGAGGIWIVDRTNITEFLEKDADQGRIDSSILHPTHRYVAQRYAWPPTLYGGRKCHVRVYGCINCRGEAFVHKRAFLHVANDVFEYRPDGNGAAAGQNKRFQPSVHITNCCANSHDVGKFAGEICADLTKACGSVDAAGDVEDVPLGKYLPSISASVAALAQRSAPFLRGGQANNGFEYLGMDFVLSSVPQSDADDSMRIPVAYLLEVNAPPSQDTATGLPHAEALHDEVITDLLRMCVLPELGIALREYGGWICVYKPEKEDSFDGRGAVVPSKAAFVNRVRWAMFERKAAQQYEKNWCQLNQNTAGRKCESPTDSFDHDAFVRFVRSQFPYFSSSHDRRARHVFLESGGGAQVPQVVMDSVVASLSNRDRSVLGAECQQKARRSLLSLLTGEEADHDRNENILIMGPNATSLLENLAQQYYAGVLREGDEIVIASENHLANVSPWIDHAEKVGAQVKWWTVTGTKKHARSDSVSQHFIESSVLSDLVSSHTKVVAISHASNILGCVRTISSICELVHRKTKHQGQVVVDGVAAAPHLLSLDVYQATHPSMRPDFYVVSLHKLFGPHLGCLIAKRSSLLKLFNLQSKSDAALYKLLEKGTMNYEACAGACALNTYFQMIADKSRTLMTFGSEEITTQKGLTQEFRSMNHTVDCVESLRSSSHETTIYCVSLMQTAKIAIQNIETILVNRLMHLLQQSSSLVRIIQDPGHQHVGYQGRNDGDNQSVFRLPTVSFVHSNIQSSKIVQHCRRHGVVCRACRFLSTTIFWKEMGINDSDVVRFSLAHYNTTEDVDRAIRVLERLDDWDAS